MSKKETDGYSPMMQHYKNLKEEYQDAILFYRLGDFYEMFFEDAILVSKLLDITLTGRACGKEEKAPMCGVPHHSAESYIAKLLRLGYKVAICEQLTEAEKGPVERDVVRVITPGTITSENILEEGKNNYILCVHRQNSKLGIAYSDISTGEFITAEYDDQIYNHLNDIITELQPAEIICSSASKDMIENLPINKIFNLPKPYIYLEKSFVFENALYSIKNQFGETAPVVFEINSNPLSIIASGALLDYLIDTQKIALKQIRKIKKHNVDKYMVIDSIARRNLELTETIRTRKKSGTLLSVLDKTRTAGGARLLRRWLEQPLKDAKLINFRLDAVEELYKNLMLRENVGLLLKNVKDIERLTSKIGMKSIKPRECNALAQSLQIMPQVKNAIINVKSDLLKQIYASIANLSDVAKLLGSVIMENPSGKLKEGGYIAKGFNEELDRLRNLQTNATTELFKLQQAERESTGIENLKISYNKVYGYYIEVPKELALKVPLHYHRKQTVGKADRYFTEALKNLENEIVAAEETSKKMEQEIFAALREELIKFIEPLQKTSKAVSGLDALISLASVASKNNYVRPIIKQNGETISITEGRHPVVETAGGGKEFIANNTYINSSTDKVLIITGPNMAGKSTYMRQVAILTLMAHIGSFVPAKAAEFSVTDRIFTRVGASDDLSSGQSTFMVEMMEMANILQNATEKSLVILDEIGRGTSTFDGLSIAWAIVEHFSKHKSKVLFATHYHELTELEGLLDGTKNYQISVKEVNNRVVFLHKIVRGGANKSFGIEVAGLAGIPEDIIRRAKEISHNIAQEDFNVKLASTNLPQQTQNASASYNVQNTRVISLLKEIDVNKISPLEALEILNELIKKVKD